MAGPTSGDGHGSNNRLAWWLGKQHAHAGSHHIQLVLVLLRPALRSAYHHSNQVIQTAHEQNV
jgi:hypothetical protein